MINKFALAGCILGFLSLVANVMTPYTTDWSDCLSKFGLPFGTFGKCATRGLSRVLIKKVISCYRQPITNILYVTTLACPFLNNLRGKMRGFNRGPTGRLYIL